MPYANPEAKKLHGQRYYAENASRIKLREKKKYKRLRRKIRARRAELSHLHLAKNAERERLRYVALRAEVIAAYGGICSCCGESESVFLELDHSKDNGAAHRKKIGRGSKACYAWLKKRWFPNDDFQLLCANCNQGRKRNGGICPHQRKANLILGADGKGHSRRKKKPN